MTIYFISQENADFQELDLEVDDFIESFPDEIGDIEAHRFSYSNLLLSSFWPRMSTGLRPLEQGKNLVPDLGHWLHAALFLSPQAHRYIGELMKPYGELLPVEIGGDVWYIFNCTAIAEVKWCGPNEFGFVPESVGDKLVFKCLEPSAQGLYCSDRFKLLVASYDLRGVEFLSVIRRFGEADIVLSGAVL